MQTQPSIFIWTSFQSVTNHQQEICPPQHRTHLNPESHIHIRERRKGVFIPESSSPAWAGSVPILDIDWFAVGQAPDVGVSSVGWVVIFL